MRETPPADYERVRHELLERGYLDGRVGRFLLTDASRGRGWLSSVLRAVLLGTPLVAALLATVVLRRTAPGASADWPLLWLYMLPISAISLALINLAAGGLSRLLASRTSPAGAQLARSAVLIGIPTLIYLSSLTRSQSAGWTAPELALLALTVVTIVFVSWLAGLVSVAALVGRTEQVGGRLGRSLRIVAGTLVAAALLLTFAQSWMRSEDSDAAQWPSYERQEEAPLVVIGIDGFGGEWVRQLEPEGAVGQTLERLASGAVIPLSREADLSPPAAWTTMLTGVGVERHGLRAVDGEQLPGVRTKLQLDGALRALLPGRQAPVSGADRAARTSWEIAAREMATLSIGWWGSWPAVDEPDLPYPAWVVSDRLLAKLISGAEHDRDVWPPQLFDRFRETFAADEARLFDRFDRWRPDGVSDLGLDRLRESFLIDAYHLALFDQLWATEQFGLGMVYLPGLDILRDRLERDELALVEKATLLLRYTAWLDGRVQRSVEAHRGRVMLIGDPGRSGSGEGFVSMTGAEIPAGCVEPPMPASAVASLILRLTGLPTGRDMAAFAPAGCLADWAPKFVDSYGARVFDGAPEPSAFDAEMLERLKSLGYLN